MANHGWTRSTRRPDGPEWKHIRALVIERDNGKCQATMRNGTQCTDRGTEVDHIVNIKSGGSEKLENLQLLCDWHHNRKSSAEANKFRQPINEQHPRESHPGLR